MQAKEWPKVALGGVGGRLGLHTWLPSLSLSDLFKLQTGRLPMVGHEGTTTQTFLQSLAAEAEPSAVKVNNRF